MKVKKLCHSKVHVNDKKTIRNNYVITINAMKAKKIKWTHVSTKLGKFLLTWRKNAPSKINKKMKEENNENNKKMK